jgi:hypothetical protein
MEKNSSELNHNPNAKIDDAIRQEVVRIADEWLSDDDPSRAAALIMIAGLFVGPDVTAIVRTMGIDSGFVQCVADACAHPRCGRKPASIMRIGSRLATWELLISG